MSDEPISQRRWWAMVAVVALIAALLRAVYVLTVARHLPLGADATWYLLQRGSIFDGTGYVDPELLFSTGEVVPTANFPPLYPLYLVAVRVVGGDSETVAQLGGALTGALAAALTAVLARRFTRPGTAILAGALVAVSPMLIAADGSLMSETLFVSLVVGAVLLAHTAGRGGSPWAWPALGAVCGLAALTRTEALLLVPLLVLPILWWSSLRRRARLLGAMAAVVTTCAVITPWMWRNADRLDSFTISTISPDTALAGANCDATFFGEALGSWVFECTRPELRRQVGEQEWGRRLRAESRTYIGDHLPRLAVVLPARELRVWGLWDPTDQVPREAVETRHEGFQWFAWGIGLATLAGGLAGLAHLSIARRRPAVVLWAPVAMVSLTALVTHGNPRFATAAEPVLAIGLAVALAGLLGGRGRGTEPLIARQAEHRTGGPTTAGRGESAPGWNS